jgi:hypothetical protein
MMLHRLALATALALVVAGCGSTATPSPSAVPTATPLPTTTPGPTPTASPTLVPSPSTATIDSSDPFAGQPYAMDLPVGWEALDVRTATQAGLAALTKENPGLAGFVEAFRSMPNGRLIANRLLGQAIVAISLPSQGLTLTTIGQSLTAQFESVPLLTSKPVAKPLTLPGGPALHWTLDVSLNKAGGGTTKVDESIYLLINSDTAVIVEFAGPHGGINPDEAKIIKTFRFQP